MIKPNVRASFGRKEAELLVAFAGPEGERRLHEQGIDTLMDDARLLRRLLQHRSHDLPASLVFYLLVRHALLEREIVDRDLADYTAALLLEFMSTDRAYRISSGDPERVFYLTDIVADLERARGLREAEAYLHLGNFALWLAGVFPDHITHRVQRKGGPPLSYYDGMGATGFRGAAGTSLAARHGLEDLFFRVAKDFVHVRSALNSLSDALFFPRAGDPVERVIREVKDRFSRRLEA